MVWCVREGVCGRKELRVEVWKENVVRDCVDERWGGLLEPGRSKRVFKWREKRVVGGKALVVVKVGL